jgi:hypothetical protein
MKKVKIYGSKWNPVMGIIVFITFMVACTFGMYQSGGKSNNGLLIPAMIFALYAAVGIIALAIRKPKLIISDYSVMVNTYVPWEACFEEIDSFYPTNYKGQEVIGIRYKKDIETGMTIEEVEDGLSTRAKTLLNPGEPYDIYVTGLAKKPKEILNLLNDRLKLSKES